MARSFGTSLVGEGPHQVWVVDGASGVFKEVTTNKDHYQSGAQPCLHVQSGNLTINKTKHHPKSTLTHSQLPSQPPLRLSNLCIGSSGAWGCRCSTPGTPRPCFFSGDAGISVIPRIPCTCCRCACVSRCPRTQLLRFAGICAIPLILCNEVFCGCAGIAWLA